MWCRHINKVFVKAADLADDARVINNIAFGASAGVTDTVVVVVAVVRRRHRPCGVHRTLLVVVLLQLEHERVILANQALAFL